MPDTITRRITLLFAAGTLMLAGCAEAAEEAGSDTATVETVTSTQPVETSAPPEATEPTSPTELTTETITSTLTPENPEDIPAEDLPYAPVGAEVTIAGDPATVCIHGDGWGTNIWAGNANTSCEFVTQTHHVLVEGLNATEQNIRDYLPEEITVRSPVTDQEYNLTCAPRGEKLVTCAGGEGAAVHFY